MSPFLLNSKKNKIRAYSQAEIYACRTPISTKQHERSRRSRNPLLHGALETHSELSYKSTAPVDRLKCIYGHWVFSKRREITQSVTGTILSTLHNNTFEGNPLKVTNQLWQAKNQRTNTTTKNEVHECGRLKNPYDHQFAIMKFIHTKLP